MLSWFGKIFGTGKALEQGLKTVDTIADGAVKGFDALFFTEEEKSNQSVSVLGMRMGMVKALQDEFAPRAITRRILAIIIVGSTFLHFQIAIVMGIMANMFPKMIKVGDETINAWTGALEFTLTILVQEIKIAMIVVFFYFGYYGVKAIMKEKSNGN